VYVQATQQVHEPSSLDEAETARRRLAYDELLFMQLTMMLRRALSQCAPRDQDLDSTLNPNHKP
jgi:ATP-dependent DNA helicase RecG